MNKEDIWKAVLDRLQEDEEELMDNVHMHTEIDYVETE